MEAAFFDLDKTIIAKSSVLAFGRSFYREGLLSRTTIVKVMYAQVIFLLIGADDAKMEKMRDAMLTLTRGWNQRHVAAIVRETLDEVVLPIIYAEALDLIEQHRLAGRKIVIVSSAPVEVVEPLAEHLGADEHIATRVNLDANGNYTGQVALYAGGKHKADAIRELASRHDIDLDQSYAYSDSISDVPMLETVGHPIAVNPDRELARLSKERGWEVLEFRNTVGLGNRTPSRLPRVIATVGSFAAIAGLGLAARARRRRAR